MTEHINRTEFRHDALRAVEAGLVTSLVYLALRPGATRAIDLFEERGLIERTGNGNRRLTKAGVELLVSWDEKRPRVRA